MKKKKLLILMSAIMALTISSVVSADNSRKSARGHYSVGISRAGGYTYANTYADSPANHKLTIHADNGRLIGGDDNWHWLGAEAGLNIYANDAYGTDAEYEVKGDYGDFAGIIQ